MARLELSQQYVRDSASEGSESASGEDSEVEATSMNKTKLPAGQKEAEQQSSQTSSTESDVDSDASQSDSSASQPAAKSLKRKNHIRSKDLPSKKAKSTPSHIPARAYQPPSGFMPVKQDRLDTALEASSLSNRQVWHLTAPASFPIAKLQAFDLQAALRGKPVLEHKGTKYQVNFTQDKSDILLLPLASPVSTGQGSETTVAYETVNVPISRSIFLHEMTSTQSKHEAAHSVESSIPSSQHSQHGDGISEQNNFFATQTGSRPAPRQQPTGLMMRYHPFGSHQNGKQKIHDPENEDLADDELVPGAHVNGFTVPAAVSDDDAMDVDPLPTKSDKKKKKQKDRSDVDVNTSGSSKKDKIPKRGNTVLSNGDVNAHALLESAQQQNGRKEKKKPKRSKRDK